MMRRNTALGIGMLTTSTVMFVFGVASNNLLLLSGAWVAAAGSGGAYLWLWTGAERSVKDLLDAMASLGEVE